nr:hypothetical protein Iba_chr12eCG4360 [Ipomoea batatas]
MKHHCMCTYRHNLLKYTHWWSLLMFLKLQLDLLVVRSSKTCVHKGSNLPPRDIFPAHKVLLHYRVSVH